MLVKIKKFYKNYDRELRLELWGIVYMTYIFCANVLYICSLDNIFYVFIITVLFFIVVPTIVIKHVCNIFVLLFKLLFKSEQVVKFFNFFYGMRYTLTKEEPWSILFIIFLIFIMKDYGFSFVFLLKIFLTIVLYFGAPIAVLNKIYDYFVEQKLLNSLDAQSCFSQDLSLNQMLVKQNIMDLTYNKYIMLKIDKLLYDGKRNITKSPILQTGTAGAESARGFFQTAKILAQTHPKTTVGAFVFTFTASVGGKLYVEQQKLYIEQQKNLQEHQRFLEELTRNDMRVGEYINKSFEKKSTIDPEVIRAIKEHTIKSSGAFKHHSGVSNDKFNSVIENGEISNGYIDVIIVMIKKIIIG